MRIHEILSRKGRDVVTVAPEATVGTAIRRLVDRNIGSLVVTDGDAILGILTERDVLRLAARRPGGYHDLPVAEVMTTDLITAGPDEEIRRVMELMTRNRVRHLPVVGDDGLEGLVSIGDVVNALRETVQAENQQLKAYIQGSSY